LDLPDGEGLYQAKFASTLEEKDHHLQNASELLEKMYPQEELVAVFVAMEEALSNAVMHGNQQQSSLQFFHHY